MSDGYRRLANAMVETGQQAAGGYEPGQKALVTSYDPKAYAVKVKLQPQDIETGWLPIQVLQAGNGFGIYAAPNVGDQVAITFENGDVQVGLMTGAVPGGPDRPPEVAAGEILIRHKEGGFLRFLTDGSIEFKTDGEIRSKGTWKHDGSLHATGFVKADGDITDKAGSNNVTVAVLRTKFNAHTHAGVQNGAGITAGPTPTAT